MGEGCAPPSPPLFFFCLGRAGLLQSIPVPDPGCEHCVGKWEGGGCAPRLASKHSSSKPRLRALRLQLGGGCGPPPPTPPLSFCCLRVEFAKGGCCAPSPPTPRLLFFCPAGFSSTHTSPFQTHAASIAPRSSQTLKGNSKT